MNYELWITDSQFNNEDRKLISNLLSSSLKRRRGNFSK